MQINRLSFYAFSIVILLTLTLIVSTGAVSAAPRATIQVFPGTKALRKALRQANPGDVLNIHAGTYNENLRIKKANLTLQSAGDGTVTVDGQCAETSVINMLAEGVTIKGLNVRGGLFYTINLEHIASGVIRNNVLEGTCEGVEYGVNVFDGGSIQVIGNTATGYDDAGIYIGGINATPNGALLVKKNVTYGNVRGIIIEDSANVAITVKANNVHDNTLTGIFIHNSDGIRIIRNTVTNNVTNGIHLDSSSDSNLVNGNTISGHTFDILNEGTDNCFNNNTYSTSSGDINAC